MEFDYSTPIIGGGYAITFPEWTYEDMPKHPNQIKETIWILGQNSRPINLEGTVDEPGNL